VTKKAGILERNQWGNFPMALYLIAPTLFVYAELILGTFVSHSCFQHARKPFKGRVHCFSMQVVMNKCFLLNPEKRTLAQIRLVVFEKKNSPLIPKNDVTEPKARKLD